MVFGFTYYFLLAFGFWLLALFNLLLPFGFWLLPHFNLLLPFGFWLLPLFNLLLPFGYYLSLTYYCLSTLPQTPHLFFISLIIVFVRLSAYILFKAVTAHI
jgi:hypothetical protein